MPIDMRIVQAPRGQSRDTEFSNRLLEDLDDFTLIPPPSRNCATDRCTNGAWLGRSGHAESAACLKSSE